MGYRAPDEARFDRLIPDPRQELFDDEWDMNEHAGLPGHNSRSGRAAGSNANRRSGPATANRGGHNDDEY